MIGACHPASKWRRNYQISAKKVLRRLGQFDKRQLISLTFGFSYSFDPGANHCLERLSVTRGPLCTISWILHQVHHPVKTGWQYRFGCLSPHDVVAVVQKLLRCLMVFAARSRVGHFPVHCSMSHAHFPCRHAGTCHISGKCPHLSVVFPRDTGAIFVSTQWTVLVVGVSQTRANLLHQQNSRHARHMETDCIH